MKRTIKKVVALASAWAIALMWMSNVIVHAASTNMAMTATSGDDNTMTVTLTWYSGNILNGDEFNVGVTDLNTWDSINLTWAGVDLVNGTWVVNYWENGWINFTVNNEWTSKVFVIESTWSFPTSADYVVTVSVQDAGDLANEWKVWATVVYKANTNTVSVSATVEPILTMSLTWTTVDFWSLNPDTLYTWATTVKVSTNATDWYVLQVANLTWWMLSAAWDMIPAVTSAEDLSSWYWYGLRVASVSDWDTVDSVASSAVTADTAFDQVANTFSPMAKSAANLATSVWPNQNSSVVVEYWVKISALQPSGNYSDTVTYTVSATY